MMIWGNLVDADKAAGRVEDGTPALAPKTWQLIRRKDDPEEVVAKSVLGYELYADGLRFCIRMATDSTT